MKILVCGLNFAPDVIGTAKYTSEMCAQLSSRGFEVKVITGQPYYPDWKVSKPYSPWFYRGEDWLGIAVLRSPLYVPKRPTAFRRILHHISFAVFSIPLLFWMNWRWRPDLIVSVAPSLLSAPAAALAGRLSGAKTWLHVQDFEIDAAFQLGFMKGAAFRAAAVAAERLLLRQFNYVSTISASMMLRLLGKGVPREKSYLLRNWSDILKIKPQSPNTKLRSSLGWDQNLVIVGYSGNIAVKQDLGLAIDAAALLATRAPQVRLLICGQGPGRADLEQRAKSLTNIKFIDLEPEDRFSELMATSDVHLLPQRAEGAGLFFPSKLGGMLAAGRPVIAMAMPGTSLAVEVRDCGIVTPPGDTNALVSAICDIANDPETRARLGSNARKVAEEHWDVQVIIDEFCRFLETLQNRSRAQGCRPSTVEEGQRRVKTID
jgi:colanic acid biosynthesis glycosyl transferase WcaI